MLYNILKKVLFDALDTTSADGQIQAHITMVSLLTNLSIFIVLRAGSLLVPFRELLDSAGLAWYNGVGSRS